MNVPTHIAIIPDGNRRWAKQRGLPSFLGHKEGASAMERVLQAARDLNIPAVTIWGCSTANVTSRSPEEVRFLFTLFKEQFARLAQSKEVKEHDTRVRILGRWEELFPEDTKKAMRDAMENTKTHTTRHLTFLMAYNGKEEMLSALKSIPRDAAVDEQAVKSHLWTKELPPVDLVIRTGDEPHWSAGFMMWDVAEAQLHFTETLWPDFSPDEFTRSVEHYAATQRRFGE